MSYSSEHFDNGWQHLLMYAHAHPDWQTAATFKAAFDASSRCTCEYSIRTAAEPFSTGRPMYIVGVHYDTTESPATRKFVAMSFRSDDGTDRLFIRRQSIGIHMAICASELAATESQTAASDLSAFDNLD
jgi:hypothetical protein